MVLKGVEIDRYAEWRADLVLTAIPATDCAGVVELHVPVLAQLRCQIAGLGTQISVPRQRQYCRLHRRQPRIQPQHGALIHTAFGIGRLILGIGVDQEGHERTGESRCGFDDIGHVPGIGGLIEE